MSRVGISVMGAAATAGALIVVGFAGAVFTFAECWKANPTPPLCGANESTLPLVALAATLAGGAWGTVAAGRAVAFDRFPAPFFGGLAGAAAALSLYLVL